MMKPILIFLTCCIVVCAVAESWAQRTDSVRQQRDSTIHNPVVPGLQSPDLKGAHEFTEENTVIVLPSEVPPALAKSLQQSEYRGWENGKIFRHLSTGEFKIEIVNDPYIRVFYFDKNGGRIVE
jgi:hypothetical protein